MRAIATFFMLAWGTLAGLFFAGMFISMGHPVKLLDHAMWGAFTLLFSTMVLTGFGNFLKDTRFGRQLAVIAAVVIALVYALRMTGVLPV